MDYRTVLQLVKLVLCIASLVMMMVLVYKRKMPWLYMFFPFVVLFQWSVFYAYVVSMQPTPSEGVTFWANLISFQVIAGILIVLIIVYREPDD